MKALTFPAARGGLASVDSDTIRPPQTEASRSSSLTTRSRLRTRKTSRSNTIRSTRAPTKDRLIGKIMGGNPAFRGTRVPVHIARRAGALARARARVTGGEV